MTKVHDVLTDILGTVAKLTMSPSDNDNAFHYTVVEKTQGTKKDCHKNYFYTRLSFCLPFSRTVSIKSLLQKYFLGKLANKVSMYHKSGKKW